MESNPNFVIGMKNQGKTANSFPVLLKTKNRGCFAGVKKMGLELLESL